MADKYQSIQNLYIRDYAKPGQVGEATNKVIHGAWTNDAFRYLANNDWLWYEKIDGTNIRIIRQDAEHNHEFTIKGRTDQAQLHSHLQLHLDKIAWCANVRETLNTLFPDGDQELCLYGEGFGGKIQGMSKLYGDEPQFACFDIKVGHHWVSKQDLARILEELKIPMAPLIGFGTLHEAQAKVTAGLKSRLARPDCTLTETWAEGIVAVPPIELRSQGERVIAKIKHKDFYHANP